ncbi:aminoglycoside phosphotransferase family protein [Cellulomonas sp.]|uniref:aminoglycoside phosphotransferase family protein n=1 Tax=Cellulomonas sp. TaxID=40001 RepID=UPI002590AC87|nr:aminoglycoside phosphotransferase family protein [Cellulomonas sp.]MCR6689980.1 aminoglycoside phosphotransferase family protein [Cellulomonas sp.]
MLNRMHDDELDLGPELVRGLLADQVPHLAHLPVARAASSGTDHAIFRLGDALAVRMPRIAWAAGVPEQEATWLPRLLGHLPVTTPALVAAGRPGRGYPWSWTVVTWVPGDNPVVGALRDPLRLAEELAALVRALRELELEDGTPYGLTLQERDEQVRRDLTALAGQIDTAAVARVWEHALEHGRWDGRRTWCHRDLAPGNLLLTHGRLTGVVDAGGFGRADPAFDLGVAWNLLPASARPVLRHGVGADDATWIRARAHALAQALVQLPYYRDRNPALAANARHVIREVLAEVATT